MPCCATNKRVRCVRDMETARASVSTVQGSSIRDLRISAALSACSTATGTADRATAGRGEGGRCVSSPGTSAGSAIAIQRASRSMLRRATSSCGSALLRSAPISRHVGSARRSNSVPGLRRSGVPSQSCGWTPRYVRDLDGRTQPIRVRKKCSRDCMLHSRLIRRGRISNHLFEPIATACPGASCMVEVSVRSSTSPDMTCVTERLGSITREVGADRVASIASIKGTSLLIEAGTSVSDAVVPGRLSGNRVRYLGTVR